MSVVINGELDSIKKLALYLQNYRFLCEGGDIVYKELSTGLDLATKYYTAHVDFSFISTESTTADQAILDNVEGYLLLPSAGDSDLSMAKYDLSKAAVNADTGLRILVAMSEGTELAHRKGYEEWALENAFEYIEINTLDPVQGFREREKYGLPRLLEALESNMWSTMQRMPRSTPSAEATAATIATAATEGCEEVPKVVPQTAEARAARTVEELVANMTAAALSRADSGCSSTSSSCSGGRSSSSCASPVVRAYEPPTPPGPEPQPELDSPIQRTTASLLPPPAAAAAVTTTTTSQPAAANRTTEADPFELEMEDKEDNEIIDKYADFISEVKNFREQSGAGQLSDEARRKQAAEMALRLAQLMNLDDESDESDGSDGDDSSSSSGV